MALQATAIVDVRMAQTDVPKLVPWLRGIGVRQVRLICGLVMFSYIFSHFFNHALGNISLEAMKWWLDTVHLSWWRNPAINATLYTAAIIHCSLGLWALYQRRHFRYTTAEITQLVLGLSIPLLLSDHFGAVRVSTMLGHSLLNYETPLLNYWYVRPYMIAVQFVLITVAWTHACIGLYFWLRLKRLFKWTWPILFAIAVLLPPLAMLGTHHAAQEVGNFIKQDPDWRRKNLRPVPPAMRATIDEITHVYFPIAYVGAILLVFAARGARSLNERRRGMVTVSYPHRQVRVPKGMSVLEASLRHKIPHASVCGGRARCSTCRVRIVSDRSALPRPSGREAFVLARVGASVDPSIRLACQLRPQSNVAVIPVLPPHVDSDFVRTRQHINVGEERYVVSMFVDMRGSTALSEVRLPYDIVFLINRFVEAVSRGITEAGGQPNQFVGDGVLALFGLKDDPAVASRQALRAAALVASNIAHLNHQFATEVSEPIQYGIGIHAGEVIIGDIGFGGYTVFTALGDSVNAAARLQEMTKMLNCKVIVSEEVCKTSGIPDDALNRVQVAIRGHHDRMTVRTEIDPTVLASLVGPASPN